MKHTRTHKRKSGFVILFAVLITAMLLLIGLGVFRVSVKEAILSSSARESTMAFFAADSGVECALYHDVQVPGFFTAPVSPVSCAGASYNVVTNGNLHTFRMALANNACVEVHVDKSNLPETIIISRGFNFCIDEDPDVENPFLLERVIRTRYTF